MEVLKTFFPQPETLPNFYSSIEKQANTIEKLQKWHISSGGGGVQKPSGKFISYPPKFKRQSVQDLTARCGLKNYLGETKSLPLSYPHSLNHIHKMSTMQQSGH